LPAPPANVWDAIVADPQLTMFTSAVQAAGLYGLFQGLDPEHPVVTLFAPTDEVLALLPEWPAIAADPAWLERFIRAQVLPDAVPAATLFAPPTDPPVEFRTLGDDLLVVDVSLLTVNGAHVDPVAPEVVTATGILHVTDGVLVVPPQTEPPPVVEEAPPVEAPPAEPAEGEGDGGG